MLKLIYSILLSLVTITAFAYETTITVAKDSSGDYASIQEAINATKGFPDEPITIYIKAGIYKEKVHVYSWNTQLSMIGDQNGETIITFDDHFKKIDKGRNSTFMTYTMKVEANDFYAENLTIENTAGSVGQAVALHVEADRAAFKNCKIKGHQDTLYLAKEGARQYFRDCHIEGSTDFIFGEATVVFQSCDILSLSNSYITAASTPLNQEYGFVFLDCDLTAADNVTEVYLGRPWRKYAKTIFVECNEGAHIKAEGWKEWSNKDNLESVYYAELDCKGEGYQPQKRVGWSKQIRSKEAKNYTVRKVFGSWMPN